MGETPKDSAYFAEMGIDIDEINASESGADKNDEGSPGESGETATVPEATAAEEGAKTETDEANARAALKEAETAAANARAALGEAETAATEARAILAEAIKVGAIKVETAAAEAANNDEGSPGESGETATVSEATVAEEAVEEGAKTEETEEETEEADDGEIWSLKGELLDKFKSFIEKQKQAVRDMMHDHREDIRDRRFEGLSHLSDEKFDEYLRSEMLRVRADLINNRYERNEREAGRK